MTRSARRRRPVRRIAASRLATGGWHPVDWLCELAGTAFVLFGAFVLVGVVESPRSPVHQALPATALRLTLIGASIGLLSMTVALSPLGRRSGAHLNPAVTLGFWARGQTHPHDLIGYAAAQIAGACLAAAAFRATAGSWARTAGYARTEPAPGLGEWPALGIEVALTFCLVFAIFLMLSSARTAPWTPVASAAALTALVPIGGPPTGASMNPARTFGPDLVTGEFGALWVYFLGPCLGVMLAAAALPVLASGRDLLTAKLFHDARYRSVHASRLPTA
ncbi:MIP/aquaporin family protein [Streptomyces specialis]|uniref:MIP/aquaporin family protein n=1 Tax=Streptomyces specialis TaxID=498367 RepID=UPI00073E7DDB|nr:aquaporin [Streptomyces specialis]